MFGRVFRSCVLKVNFPWPVSFVAKKVTYFSHAEQRHFAIVAVVHNGWVKILPRQMCRRAVPDNAKRSTIGPQRKVTCDPIESFAEGGAIHNDIAEEPERSDLGAHSYMQSESAVPSELGGRFEGRDELLYRHTGARIAELCGFDPNCLTNPFRLDSRGSRCHDISDRLCRHGKSRPIHGIWPGPKFEGTDSGFCVAFC